MKKILGMTVALAMLLTSVFCGVMVPASAENTKVYYDNFDAGLSTTPSATGNGSNTDYVMAADGATYSASDGVLHLQLTNSNYLRIQNTMTGIDNYQYMVVRMKGTYSWDVLTGNTIAFWFGSYGTPGAKLYVSVEDYTSDYSNVVITIPAGYFDSIGADYKACMFITTERGATFNVDIDEIYFTNTLPSDEPEEPVEQEEETAYYSDFSYDFTSGAVPSGYGENTVTLVNNDGTTYSISDGALHLVVPQGKYLRMSNTMTDIDQYDYMILRMRGSHNYGSLTGNALRFWFGSYGTPGASLYMSVDNLTAEYSDVVVTIPDGYFDSIAADYKANLFITSERGATFTVDIDKIYFTNTIPTYSRGDLNTDGVINILDLIRLKRILAGLTTETTASDIGGNGAVNGTDLAILQGYLLTGIFGKDEVNYNKFIYNDFESGLGATFDARTPTGNGNYVSYAVSAEGGAIWSVADGVLNLQVTNGQWLRTWNTTTGLENYKYMVLRMKGSYDWDVLNGNSLSFKFGSGGSQTAVVAMTAEQLTEDYSYVFVEIPNPETFYSAVTVADYRYGLWIGAQRGATFNVEIDEIFFTNDEPIVS